MSSITLVLRIKWVNRPLLRPEYILCFCTRSHGSTTRIAHDRCGYLVEGEQAGLCSANPTLCLPRFLFTLADSKYYYTQFDESLGGGAAANGIRRAVANIG